MVRLFCSLAMGLELARDKDEKEEVIVFCPFLALGLYQESHVRITKYKV